MARDPDNPTDDYMRRKGFTSHNAERSDGSEYAAETVEFIMAIEKYKRDNHRPFPALSEILEVAKALGWRKVL